MVNSTTPTTDMENLCYVWYKTKKAARWYTAA